MLVCFLGCPLSGKTTIAKRLQLDFKKDGSYPVEELDEQARKYIATKRVHMKKTSPSGKVENFKLYNEDQLAIMKQQFYWEEVYVQSMSEDPDSIIIADSCSLNALAYMKGEPDGDGRLPEYPQLWASEEVRTTMSKLIRECNPLFFYCRPVDVQSYRDGKDLHRVHTQNEMRAIDDVIKKKLMPYFKITSFTELSGNEEARYSTASARLFSHIQNVMKARIPKELQDYEESH